MEFFALNFDDVIPPPPPPPPSWVSCVTRGKRVGFSGILGGIIEWNADFITQSDENENKNEWIHIMQMIGMMQIMQIIQICKYRRGYSPKWKSNWWIWWRQLAILISFQSFHWIELIFGRSGRVFQVKIDEIQANFQDFYRFWSHFQVKIGEIKKIHWNFRDFDAFSSENRWNLSNFSGFSKDFNTFWRHF